MLKPSTEITTNWKIPKETGIPDHLTCLLRNLCFGEEVTELDLKQCGTTNSLVHNWERSASRLYTVTLPIYLT